MDSDVKELAFDLQCSLTPDEITSDRIGFLVIDYIETAKKLIALGYSKGE